jgi:OOP family OmpA-OmpF porin
MKTINKLILAAFIPLTIAPMIGMTADFSKKGEWVNATNTNWKTSAGECWRSSSWTPANATAECDPGLFKKAEIAPAPIVVAAAEPAPASAPAPAPLQTEVRKLTFNAQDLFAFDKSELKPEGKEKLNQLADDLNHTQNNSIVATGYADRIGNKKYNQKLSERRAESVRSYLISKGISSDLVRAEGKGEADPVTQAGDCKGPRSKKVIACLQPNRRVEVAVTATRLVTVNPN